MGIPRLAPEPVPPAVHAADAYAADAIRDYEYNTAVYVAELEEALTPEARAEALRAAELEGTPICETIWSRIEAGDFALISRHGQVVKVEVRAVKKGKDSVLIDYTVGNCSYYEMLYLPNDPAFIQQR